MSALNAPLCCHGVMLKIFDTGVLLQGESGIGKSEIALSLLERNHQLVADDLVILQPTLTQLIACTTPRYLGCMALRSLGVIQVRDYFGPHAVVPRAPLQLVIQLEKQKPDAACGLDQPHRYASIILANHPIPQLRYHLPTVAPIALCLEIAVQQFLASHVASEEIAA